MNYHAHGQTGKSILNYHENFEHIQSEWQFMIVDVSAWQLAVKRKSVSTIIYYITVKFR